MHEEANQLEQLRILDVEIELGIADPDETSDSSLTRWYSGIRHKKISEFDVKDIIRFIRQQLYLPYIMPVAIASLRENPFAGEQYEGELLKVLSRVPFPFWANHRQLRDELKTVIGNVNNVLNTDEENNNYSASMNELIEKLECRGNMEILKWIQDWYSEQCDGSWEHGYGIRITTLDNPGWHVSINLSETDLEHETMEVIRVEHSDLDWIFCKIEDGVFSGAGGVKNLEEILHIFYNIAN